MAQNIYDDPDFFDSYSRLNRSVHGLDGAPEWPAIVDMLPDLHGRRLVDLGCGFGWFSRWAREAGAASVLALDLSENMLAHARADTADPAIVYAKADLETLDLPRGEFDLAYSSLALHYVADFGRLARTVFDGLGPGGHLVFSIEHPIFMASRKPDWLVRENGRRSWPVDGYASEGARTTDWLAPGVVKYHRTLGTTLNHLIEAGFALRKVVEWSPSSDQLDAQPALADELERPMMVLVAARRP